MASSWILAPARLCTVSCSTDRAQTGSEEAKLKVGGTCVVTHRRSSEHYIAALLMNFFGSVYCEASCQRSERPCRPGLKDLVKGFDVVIVGLSVLGYDFELASNVDAACRSTGA